MWEKWTPLSSQSFWFSLTRVTIHGSDTTSYTDQNPLVIKEWDLKTYKIRVCPSNAFFYSLILRHKEANDMVLFYHKRENLNCTRYWLLQFFCKGLGGWTFAFYNLIQRPCLFKNKQLQKLQIAKNLRLSPNQYLVFVDFFTKN